MRLTYSILLILLSSCSLKHISVLNTQLDKVNLKLDKITILTGRYTCRNCVEEVVNYYSTNNYEINLIFLSELNFVNINSILKEYNFENNKKLGIYFVKSNNSNNSSSRVYKKYYKEPSPIILENLGTDSLRVLNYQEYVEMNKLDKHISN